MSNLKKEAIKIIKNLENEEIKFLNLLDRVGLDKIIDYTKDLISKDDLKRSIESISENYLEEQYEDNIDILEKLILAENPFLKDFGFKNFYNKMIVKDQKDASFSNIYKLNSDKSYDIKNGVYKNIFTGLKVKIVAGNDNLAHIYKLSDRMKKLGREFITLKDIPFFEKEKELSNFFDDDKIKKIEQEYILYHELAHISGVQILQNMLDEKRSILMETHSDICGIIKTIQSNELDKNEAKALLNDILMARSHYKFLSNGLFSENEIKYSDHLTQVGLILLRDYIDKDLDYILTIKDDEISKFSWIMTEQSHQPSYISMLEEKLNNFPKNNLELENLFKEEMKNPRSLIGRIFNKYKENNPEVNVEKIAASRIINDSYISLDISFRLMKTFNKDELLNIKYPFSDNIINVIKDDFEYFREEFNNNKFSLSKVFDSNELTKKTNKFRFRSI